MPPRNDWNEYKKLFINEMTENREFRKTMTTIMGSVREDIAGLKVKAAIAGGMAGLVGTGLMSVILNLWK